LFASPTIARQNITLSGRGLAREDVAEGLERSRA